MAKLEGAATLTELRSVPWSSKAIGSLFELTTCAAQDLAVGAEIMDILTESCPETHFSVGVGALGTLSFSKVLASVRGCVDMSEASMAAFLAAALACASCCSFESFFSFVGGSLANPIVETDMDDTSEFLDRSDGGSLGLDALAKESSESGGGIPFALADLLLFSFSDCLVRCSGFH